VDGGKGEASDRFDITIDVDPQSALSSPDWSLPLSPLPQVGLDMSETSPSAWSPQAQEGLVPPPLKNVPFVTSLTEMGSKCSWEADARIFHGHGHTCREIFQLRNGQAPGRVPDVVVWPQSHSEVEAIVAAAVEHDVCVVPYGGGTSVTAALQVPEEEARMVVSLDMHDMCRVLQMDKASLMVTVEAGMTGLRLEKAP